DTVYVRGGTYYEEVTFTNSGSVGMPITFVAYPNEAVYISGDGFTLNMVNYTTIEGFDFTGGGSYAVRIAYNSDSIIIKNNSFIGSFDYSPIYIQAAINETPFWRWQPTRNLIIEDNYIDNHYGVIHREMISVSDSLGITIRNNTLIMSRHSRIVLGIVLKDGTQNAQVYGNHIENVQYGVYIDARAVVSNISIYNNIIKNSVPVGLQNEVNDDPRYRSIATIENVNIFNNILVGGSGLNGINFGTFTTDSWDSSKPNGIIRNVNVINNVFYGFDYAAVLGMSTIPSDVSGVTFRNNIFDSNNLVIYTATGTVIDNNLFNGASGQGTNQKIGSPLFVNPAGGDFHIQSASPAKDAGTAVGAPSTDFDGNPRPFGAGYDIGVYEYQDS
ncbi:MAG: hypothetical protein KAS12_03175, partial [Candidatus Aenigmarchaeota archaeon]|nr:hypothetical protein [Candidatus Aenigmarchaeota archaeon]